MKNLSKFEVELTNQNRILEFSRTPWNLPRSTIYKLRARGVLTLK